MRAPGAHLAAPVSIKNTAACSHIGCGILVLNSINSYIDLYFFFYPTVIVAFARRL